MVTLPVTGPYTAKDQLKSNKATKFIGRGSSRSSTAAYARAWGDKANCGTYAPDDVVFVSAEGARTGRVPVDYEEIGLAAAAGATFVTDNPANRVRPYNVGEREVALCLVSWGYIERSAGVWTRG